LRIERAALHAFRHMAASELIENGVAPSVVQRQMRHSDSRITLQKYAHVIVTHSGEQWTLLQAAFWS
jgi:integrase